MSQPHRMLPSLDPRTGRAQADGLEETTAQELDAVCSGGRSSQGLRIANSTAEFDCAALVRKFSPLIEPTMSTPGVRCRISRTCLATASVRSSEAPSGSWMTTKK